MTYDQWKLANPYEDAQEPEPCPICAGSGWEDPLVPCKECEATGEVSPERARRLAWAKLAQRY